MSVDQDPIVGDNPSPNHNNHHHHHLEPPSNLTRKVSIIELNHGHDNPAFDSPRSRKISTASEHADMSAVKKKSILHNNHQTENNDNNKHVNGDSSMKKHSLSDSIHSKTRISDIDDNENRSWWYTFCLKCRQEESHPSWQPTLWPRICPYPFCPSYRQFSRIIAIILIGSLSWAIFYSVVGETAGPKGHIFQLILLSICAYFGGWLISLTTLPALIGMLFMGIILQNTGIVNIDNSFSEINKELRHVALVIILIRAGLDLDPTAMRKLKFTLMKIGIVPWIVETAIVAVLSHYLLGMPWDWAMLASSIVSAVSPAVIVPCLLRLRVKGYGVAKGIPTLIIAISGIDDALSVALFGIVKSIMFSNESMTSQILQGPISVFGGIIFGIIWGVICYYTPEKHDPFVVPLRILLLLVGGMIAVFGSEALGYGGAGPLGCVTAAFLALYFWSKQGWEIEDNPASTAFEIFWLIFEPILFGITGAQMKFDELDKGSLPIVTGVLLAGFVLRIVCTLIIGIGCKLNMKEKVFSALALMSKATVQAALGPVALGLVAEGTVDHDYAHKTLMLCVLSIILTAPTGAIIITFGGPRLLTKTKIPVIPEGWRRSHRPSIRDISIIDEDEERPENIEDTIQTNLSKESSKSELS